MTTKEIGESVGKKERTVQLWAKRAGERIPAIGAKIAAVQKTGKPADYDLSEAIEVIEEGMGKEAASVYKANAEHSPVLIAPEAIAAIVRETVGAMLPAIVAAVRGIVPAKTAAALPASPALSDRDRLRLIVATAAQRQGGFREDHRDAWAALYRADYYRNARSLRQRARNRGMDTLDYAEAEGLLPALLALAMDVFGGGV